jgi:hypothetical protein
MPSNIFGSSDRDEFGSESEQEEKESEPEAPEEETEPETEAELVDCPGRSQADTLEECPAATVPAVPTLAPDPNVCQSVFDPKCPEGADVKFNDVRIGIDDHDNPPTGPGPAHYNISSNVAKLRDRQFHSTDRSTCFRQWSNLDRKR